MKYGETVFDIAYLLFAIGTGIFVLTKKKDKTGRLMGISALILGIGDAFHLIPRVAAYYTENDLTAWLGFGKLVTSLTMTVFYVLLFYLHTNLYEWESKRDQKISAISVFLVSITRFTICFASGNKWLSGGSSVTWGILRNIPFVILGAWIIGIYFVKRDQAANFRRMWLYVLLSFLFYIPVAVFASVLPLLGMLMIPKTICYMLMLGIFIKEART